MTWLNLVPRWAWWVAGGVAMTIGLLVLWQSAIGHAERRGYERAQQEAYEAAQAQAEAWRDQLEKAQAEATKLRRKDDARFAPIQRKARDYAATAAPCPDAAGRLLLNEAIRASNDAATAKPRG